MMQRNRRRIVILIVLVLLGVVGFAFTYQAIANQANRGSRSAGALAGY